MSLAGVTFGYNGHKARQTLHVTDHCYFRLTHPVLLTISRAALQPTAPESTAAPFSGAPSTQWPDQSTRLRPLVYAATRQTQAVVAQH